MPLNVSGHALEQTYYLPFVKKKKPSALLIYFNKNAKTIHVHVGKEDTSFHSKFWKKNYGKRTKMIANTNLKKKTH